MAGFFKKLLNKVTNKAEIDWDELEADLIGADLGARTAMAIIDDLQALGRKVSGDDIVEVCKQHIAAILKDDQAELKPRSDGKPMVILVVGVNGTGKTTSSAKLAYLLKSQGHSVMLAAADTFRAAAVEQLGRWGERLDIPVVKGAHNADPASVCYTAHQKAITDGADFLICDTAGRIHTRHNLMQELGKIERTIGKQDESAPHLKLLVVDATTGGNALAQAKEFNKAIELDGLIVTKMDGSGKGGVAVLIQKELDLPTWFIGLGEEPEQFKKFNKEEFADGIF
ncbi:signal recognition particle-docking protein FtsY [Verrucomicrobiaceae bacterium R5-34]|uniref:Signal recognition particle-docking protein FtsY n=1 Tax=Oceaniferula flava TaxID=2800421 RepID=A0AAE2SBE8_9BACT|nr:signal recognition particle-docking protein FtsY [Oceaniferula flavus]MBK1829633.1 signal recognition particle-docking protein FtsY [Verrucomicrobiaceae bacterium R5-34]MBK1853824.1 signal recognition particle-docking protein FtsY [Oceaniferula flavus]MBM1135130.1 signal recognition particle-docking protein FtsY [Oceaniferula flavus]